MEKRIELERRGLPPGSVVELNLDNCRSTSIIGLTDEFSNLRTLSLINVGLISLRGFPVLPNLIKIELSDNRISGGLYHLHGSPKLVYINLGGNRISDFEALEPLQEFKHLKCLDLFANKIECYKEKVFDLLPSLTYLDGLDRDDKEMTSDEENEVNGNEDESDSEDSICEEVNGNEEGSVSESPSSSSIDDEESDGDSSIKNDEYDLGKVYDPDLKDDSDNEDYDGEGAEEEDDDDDDFDDDEEEEYANVNDEEQDDEEEAAAPAPASEEDATPRGKKRKHDDAEEGQDV